MEFNWNPETHTFARSHNLEKFIKRWSIVVNQLLLVNLPKCLTFSVLNVNWNVGPPPTSEGGWIYLC